jgi:predicted naringenin-chalcone synthase
MEAWNFEKPVLDPISNTFTSTPQKCERMITLRFHSSGFDCSFARDVGRKIESWL